MCEPLPEPTLRAQSLLRPGAPDDEIDRAEARLGIELPASFRAFLAYSDGAYADWEVVPARLRRHGESGPEFGLLPAHDLVAAHDVVPDSVEMWAEYSDRPEPEPRVNRSTVVDFAPLLSAILVCGLTQEAGKFFLCLAPVDADDAPEPFELWDKGHEETTRYLTFADWLELTVSDRWYDPGPVFHRVNADIGPATIAAFTGWPSVLLAEQVRRLVACAPSPALTRLLDELWSGTDPFVRLAAAQVHALVGGTTERVTELAEGDEPSVALSATTTLDFLR